MNNFVNYIRKNNLLICYWIISILLFTINKAVIATWPGIREYIQILLIMFILGAIISLPTCLFISIKTQKMKYFSNSLWNLFIQVIGILIIFSSVDVYTTNIIRGNPIIQANYRGIKLILRENNNYDIWGERFIIFDSVDNGTFSKHGNEILFSRNSFYGKLLSDKAEIISYNYGKVIRFNFSDSSRVDFFVIK